MHHQPFFSVEVVRAWDETAELRAITVELRAIAAHHQAAGQVLRLRLPTAPALGEAHFALANASFEPATLLCKRGSPLGDALIKHAAPGERVEVTAPLGAGFPVKHARDRDVLLFASGAGIAPIRALLQTLVHDRSSYGKLALYYGQRRETHFAYSREQAHWKNNNVDVVLCCSQPSGVWNGERGYVQEVAQRHLFSSIALNATSRAVAFLCGTHNMVRDVRATLAATGMPANQVFLNY